MKNFTSTYGRFSESFHRLLAILALNVLLAAFALPGLSKSPGARDKISADTSDSPRPIASLRKHPKKNVKAAASQSAPMAISSDGAKEATGENSGAGARRQNIEQGPKIWLQDTKKLATSFSGMAKSNTAGAANLSDASDLAQGNALALLLGAGQGQPLSMVKGDLDQDGVEDLVVGYSTPIGPAVAIYRGNLDAFAPQSDDSFRAIGRGEFPSPFLPEAYVISVPVNPDFIVAGDFAGQGNTDLLIAARGGNALYLLRGDGKGNFGTAQMLSISGGVTTLAVGEFGNPSQGIKLFVGTSGPTNGFGLSVFSLPNGALSMIGSYPLTGAASNIEFGYLGDTGTDAVFISSGRINVLRPSMQLEQISLPVSASALALGSFIYDRSGGSQIAVLGTDGSVHITARAESDPRMHTAQEFKAIRLAKIRHQTSDLVPAAPFSADGWKIVESFPFVGTVNASQSQIFFRTRVSSNGADDIMWLNGSAGHMLVISHPDAKPGAQTFLPGQLSDRPYTGSPLHAFPMRTNIDGRPGIVAIHQGEIAPSTVMPIPDPTFFPNQFNDPVVPTTSGSPDTAAFCNNLSNTDTSSPCSLREAIIKANVTAGTDTIMLVAGTYTLTQPRAANPNYDALTGTLNINDSVNIVGAGQNSTVITWGTPASGTIDMTMAVNEDIPSATVPSTTTATASISNLTIQNAVNNGSDDVNGDGDGGCMEYDTGTNGTATLTLTNVTLQNCRTVGGGGGGLVIFNSVTPAGGAGATISNSIIQGNSVVEVGAAADGGGIAIAQDAHMVMTGSQVKNNKAVEVASGQMGTGGGIIAFTPQNVSATTGETLIHSSAISGNESAGFGGGIWSGTDLVIDTGTVISGNTAGTTGSSPIAGQEGGGLYSNTPTAGNCPLSSTCTTTLAKVTITGNTATGNGGGVSNGDASGAGALTMSFSRLAGNVSSGGAGSNLNNSSATATVTDNWWGTNSPAGTINTISGTTTFDPFIVLTHTASPQTIEINASTTLIGNMSQDNHGNAAALNGNLNEIAGLPLTFSNPVLGTIPQTQPETLNASAQATATFNAGGVAGVGTADATVDQAIVPVNSNLISSATESGTTATITTVGAHGFSTGELVKISGVGASGYNTPFGQFSTIIGTPTSTTFTYTASATGMASAIGGTADAGILILQPPSITKAFNPTTIQTTAGTGTTVSTITFGITNGNVVPIDASFTDVLPNPLAVATTPSVGNNCGGLLTATAGSGSISFSNATLAVGTCTITVRVQSVVDNTYTNSVTIDSTDAGSGNTATASLTVISPPAITKVFGATTIPLNGATSLTLTLSNSNVNSTFSGVAFTDLLPSGLVVATPSNLISTCSGTATAVAGSSSATLGSASLAPGASCTVSLNVQGTTGGVKNNSVQVTSTNGGTGNTSNASVTVVGPPVINKAFGAASISLNSSTSLSFTIQNNNTGNTLSGIGFTDTLPVGLTISTPNGLTGGCGGGTITATQATGTVSLSGAALAQSTSCTFSVNVTGTTGGAKNNTTSTVTSVEAGTGGTASASANVVAPPSIAKAFSPTTIPLNGVSTLTFTVTNPAANTVAETGVAYTDTLPTGLVMSTPSGLTNTCAGTATAVAGSTSVSLTGGTVAVNTACTVVVNVTGAASGQYTNTSGAVSSTNGGTGNTATANLTVASPPTIAKAFGAASIPLNGATSLTFNISNPNTNVLLSGVAFTDSLPAGLVVATPSNLTSTCGGTATAVAGSSSASLSAGTMAVSASCAVSLNVQGTTAGVKNNSVQVTSTEGGTGNTSNASVTVSSPPVIIKAFGAASIPLNGSTSLSFTTQNNNTTQSLSGIGFTDTLPAGLAISTPNGLTGSCGAGAITATQATNIVSLSGATLAQSTSCTFSVNVTGTTGGAKNNTTSAVTSTEGGTGGTALASIAVVAPPAIAKAFNPTTISLSGVSTLTFTITNPAANSVAQTGVAYNDTLPAGLVVSTPNGLTNTCAGTATAVAGSTSISLTGGTVAVNTACTVVVNVTGAASGQYTNTSGAVSSTNGGTGNTATANLTVASPPTIAKAFGAANIPLNGATSLTFNISNPNTNVLLSGVAFTDSLPAGLVVATPSNLTSTCGGTATAVAGSSSASLSAGTLAVSASCAVSLNVQGTIAGAKNNSVQVTSTEGGTGNTSNASVTVTGPAVIVKAFGSASIPLNGSTSLSFTIQNNNATQSLSGIAFTDTLPAGLVISTPNGLTGSCGAGAITATQATGAVSLSGATLAQSTSCTFLVNVTGMTGGAKNNTTSAVTSIEGGTGGTALASIGVVAPPAIAKAFNPTTILLNGVSALTFTITNPAANSVAQTGVAYNDTLPAGLVVSTPNGLTNTCAGTATAVAGSTSISLTGGTVAVNTACTVAVNVNGTASGQFTNTSGAVSSTNGGTGNTATAKLTVASPPTIAKAFGAASIPLNGATSLTFNISNPNTNVLLSGVAFTDSLPAGLVVATPSNLTSTCGGTATAVAGSSSASLSAGTMAVSASCAVSLNVQGTIAGAKNNSVQVTSTEGGTGNTSNASVTVTGPAVIVKAFGSASIPLNGSTSLSFTIQNNNATQSLSGIAFTDTLPVGLVISTPNGLTGSCGAGAITATQATNIVSLSGATLASSTSCTFSVRVTGMTAGAKNNTTSAVTSTEGGTGGTALASIAVVAPPAIAKAFNPTTILLNGVSALTFTVTNPAANSVAEAGVAFTDALPAGLVVSTPNGLTNTCGGTSTATAGSAGISLTGGTVAVNTSCTVSVNVTGTASGQFTNTSGAVSSTNGGTGNTATANITVGSPPAITKAFGAAAIPLNGTTSLTFNITNPNTNVTLTGVAFTDNLPAGLVVATPSALNSTCGATAIAAGGSSVVTLAAGTLASTASCTVSLNVQGTGAGVKNNSVQVTSIEGGAGNTSTATVTVMGPPVIIKAFGAASIPLNGSTSLSFTIQNNNTTTALTGVTFTDALPAGLVISTPNGLTGSCGGGTITGTPGTNIVNLSGASLAASASCTFSVNVSGTAAGTQNNTTGAVTSANGGTGGTASASIAVVAPPSIAKAFRPTTTTLNGTSSLTFTITNPAANAVALTGVAFTDTLPTGLTVASSSIGTCGGTLTITASVSIALSGANIAANSLCQFSVTVTGAISGQFTNTTGTVSSTNGGTGNTASANLTVASAPVIAKSFGASSIPLNGSTSLSFTITNPAVNTVALTGVALTDNLPAGLVVATPNGLTGLCGGGTITSSSGSGAVSLFGATLAANSACTFSVNVTGTAAGVKNNSVTVTSTNAGTGNTSSATTTVIAPPTLLKAFGAASVPLNGGSSLTFTVSNPNAAASLTGVGFTDALPAGLVISAPNGLTGACGGGAITAAEGSGSITLAGSGLAASASCSFTVNVTGITAGAQNNTTRAVVSNEGGAGGTASASLAVVAPPSIGKVFNPGVVIPGGNSTLTFTIMNPAANTVGLTGVAFTDALPAGIQMATPNGLTGSCGSGAITATAGSGRVTLTAGTITAAGSCTFSVTVTGTAAGNYTNTTGTVTSTNGGTGNASTANITVAASPSITKSFSAVSIGLAGSTALNFTITNPNSAVALTGVAFTDTLPAGLVVATPNGISGTCGSGTVTAVGGSGSVTLTGGAIAVSASCTFAVNVTATIAGNKVNTTGNVSAVNGGTGNTATASINVLAPDLTITKSHTGNFGLGETGATYTLTANNIGPGPTAGTVTVIDTLPASLTTTAMTGTGWTCVVATVSCTRADALAASASYPPITLTVNVSANAPNSVVNAAAVSGGGELNVANDTVTDTTVVTTFTLSVAQATLTIHAGQTAIFALTVTPQGGAYTLPINFTDTGTPPRTAVTFVPSSVTPGANPTTLAMNLQTTQGLRFLSQNMPQRTAPSAGILLPFGMLFLIGACATKLSKDKKQAHSLALALVILFFGMGLMGCVGTQKTFNELGTPAGTYPLVVTASANGVPVSINVTLIVQP